MTKPSRVALYSALAVLSLFVWDRRPAAAEPTEACRGLAGLFANTPAQLDMASLAALAVCVTTEMGQRSASVPPPQAGALPSTGPESQPVPSPHTWGQWPQSSPWGADWPQSSWDQ